MVVRNIVVSLQVITHYFNMTEKQEKILHAALELFASEGFKATSTSRVAKQAGVSEGLIFRHFGSKEGLLEAIIKEGEERSRKVFAPIIFESDPREAIRKTFDLMLEISNNKEEYEFWKLQYKIKWETEKYNEQKMEPLHLALTNAFTKLGYKSPGMEALLLLIDMDGLATRISLQKGFDLDAMIAFLKEKYKV